MCFKRQFKLELINSHISVITDTEEVAICFIHTSKKRVIFYLNTVKYRRFVSDDRPK